MKPVTVTDDIRHAQRFDVDALLEQRAFCGARIPVRFEFQSERVRRPEPREVNCPECLHAMRVRFEQLRAEAIRAGLYAQPTTTSTPPPLAGGAKMGPSSA